MIRHKTLSPRVLALGLGLILAMITSIAGVPLGHADPGSTTTPSNTVVDKNKDGSITVHSLAGDTGVAANGAEVTPAPTNATIQGSVFKLTKHAGIDVSTNTGMASAKEVTLTSFSADSSFGTSGAKQCTTGSDGTCKLDQLKPGVYKLEQLSAPAGKQTAVPAIVILPLTNPQGNGFMYDIHVYPKNANAGKITKTNTTPSGTFLMEGAAMEFTIKVPIPKKVGTTLQEFTVTDKPVSGLTVDENSIKEVKAGDSTTLTKTTDYTVAKSGNDVTVTFTTTGLGKLDTATGDLLVKVNATLSNIASAPNNTVKNKAAYSFKFKDGSGGNGETGDNDNPDANLTFGYVKIKNTNGTADLTGGVFKVGKCKADNKSVDPAAVASSNATTMANVGPIGPLEGAKLCVEQTTAPTGYALNPEATAIDFTATAITGATDKTLEALVENAAANDFLQKLPLTGGPGVIAFLVGGALLLIAAVITMVRKRHKD